jgi:predicted enzyme related to lactoylglutathione lyase
MDMRLELVPLPSSDVDASKEFYVERVGFTLDHDVEPGNGMRIVQLTPPGSDCSVVLGVGIGDPAAPPVTGLHLVVGDIEAARAELLGRGVDVSGVDDMGGVKYAYFADPDGNSWALQEIPGRGGRVFDHVDLSGARFEHVDLTGARFASVDLTGAEFRSVDIKNVALRGVEMGHVVITGEILDVTVNGVDIGPLVEAELDRRDPDRPRMRPTDPAGFREAWDVVERRWAVTVERARRLPADLLHESVDGEWSFIETLRHLAFATDAWVRRGILGDPAPWDPLDLPWDQMPDTPGTPRDREVRPSLDEALALRHDRMATVRTVVDGLTDESLAADTTPVDAPGWPPPRSFPVRDCLLVVLNEEWEHREYAERDLAVLEERLAQR